MDNCLWVGYLLDPRTIKCLLKSMTSLWLYCSVIFSHLNHLDRYGVDVKCTSRVLEYCSYIRKKVWLLFVSIGNQKLFVMTLQKKFFCFNSNWIELSLRYVNLSNIVEYDLICIIKEIHDKHGTCWILMNMLSIDKTQLMINILVYGIYWLFGSLNCLLILFCSLNIIYYVY